MGITSRLSGIALIVLAAGCASNPAPQSKAGDPELVRITGSRVMQPAARLHGLPGTAYPLHVVTREDIRRTGAADTGEALDDLPFVEIHR